MTSDTSETAPPGPLNLNLSDPNDTTTTIIIALTGPSSSGKTTLARLLRSIFSYPPHLTTTIIHQDDFYKPDVLIPLKTFSSPEHGTRTLQDWDCIEAIDVELLGSTLRYVKAHGCLPDDGAVSKEDQNAVGRCPVDQGTIRELATRTRTRTERIFSLSTSLDNVSHSNSSSKSEVPIQTQTSTLLTSASNTQFNPKQEHKQNENGISNQPRRKISLYLLDGFLLLPDPISPLSALHTHLHQILASAVSSRLFLPSTREQTLRRRAARSGYVTLEGFWEDPPGYVEDVVWRNYAVEHWWLFSERGRGRSQKDREGGKEEKDERDEVMRRVNAGEVVKQTAEGEGVMVAPMSTPPITGKKAQDEDESETERLDQVLIWAWEKVWNIIDQTLDEA